MIVVATSGANDCLYCIVAHGAILRIYAKNPLRRRPGRGQLSQGRHHAAAEGDARRSRSKVALRSRSRSTTTTSPRCAAHGFSDEDIWDIGGDRRVFRAVEPDGELDRMRPNDEFYLLGRVPKNP